jgi:hypothetical protein
LAAFFGAAVPCKRDFALSRIRRLTLLAPEVVEAVLDGKQPRALELKMLLKPFPLDWDEQRQLPALIQDV